MLILQAIFYVFAILGLGWIGLMTTGILALKLYSYWDIKRETENALKQAGQPQYMTIEEYLQRLAGGRGGPGAAPGNKSGPYAPYPQSGHPGQGGGFPPGHPGQGGGGVEFVPPGRYA
jgi:hypothetical protein